MDARFRPLRPIRAETGYRSTGRLQVFGFAWMMRGGMLCIREELRDVFRRTK